MFHGSERACVAQEEDWASNRHQAMGPVFAGYVSVLSTKYPQVVPEMMAYLTTIVKCSKVLLGPNTTGASGSRWQS